MNVVDTDVVAMIHFDHTLFKEGWIDTQGVRL